MGASEENNQRSVRQRVGQGDVTGGVGPGVKRFIEFKRAGRKLAQLATLVGRQQARNARKVSTTEPEGGKRPKGKKGQTKGGWRTLV